MRRGKASEAAPLGAGLLRGLVLVLAALPLLPAQGGAQEVEGKTVREIRLVGLERQSAEAVRALMETRVGEPFRAEVFDRDLKRLAGAPEPERGARAGEPPRPGEAPREPSRSTGALFGRITQARAELTDDGEGVVVTLEVEENRRVLAVVFTGALDFDREELLPIVSTRTGAYVDAFLLDLDRRELLRQYRREGYAFAEVEVVTDRREDGDVVVFRITEGPEVRIRNVEFPGAESFPKEDLLEALPGTEEPGWFSSKRFVAEEVRRDRADLVSFYRDHGFLNATVALEPPRPTSDYEDVDLVFRVEEGEEFRVRSIRVEGLGLRDPEEVVADWRTQIGGRYEPGYDLKRDMDRLLESLQNLGYTEARVTDISVPDLETAEVDVVVKVEENQLTRVGAIVIRGNVETQDRVIRREIELYSGEPLDLSKLKRAEQRIRALRYWEPGPPNFGVRVDNRRTTAANYEVFKEAYVALADTEQENVQDLVIDVEETDTSRLRFAAGIGSNAGVIGDITYTKQNFDPFDLPDGFDDLGDSFTGAGQTLILSFQPGPTLTRWRALWANPRLFDGPYGLSVELFQTLWLREDWDEDRLGYGLRGTRRVAEDLELALSLRDERVRIDDVDDDSPQLVFDFEGDNRLTTVGFEARLERLNDFFAPSEGYEIGLSLEHAGLWGDIEFNKLRLNGDHYTLLGEDELERPHVLRLRGTAGWAAEYGDTHDIPVYERFYAGGAGTIRGFSYRDVGPRDAGDPIGGKAIWLASTEYHFPIVGENLRGVTFLDTGSVAENWGDPGIADVRASVGAGIRLVIPFLSAQAPLAIDFGFPLLKEDEDETQIISFSFGTR